MLCCDEYFVCFGVMEELGFGSVCGWYVVVECGCGFFVVVGDVV